MIAVLLNVLLALIWVAATGRFTLMDLVVGWVLGFVVLWILGPAVVRGRYVGRTGTVLSLLAHFLKELFMSGVRVAVEVLTPAPRTTPGIVAVPLELEGEVAIATLANMITLTPGSLTLEISPDRRTLYVHSLFADDPEWVRRSVKDGFERRILEIFR